MHSKNGDQLENLCLCSANEGVRGRWLEAIDSGMTVRDVTSLAQLDSRLQQQNSEVILLHMQLPELAGVSGVIQRVRSYPAARFMIFTDRPDTAEGLFLLRHGCYGYFNTYLAPRLLTRAIDMVASGQVLINRDLMAELMRLLAMARPEAIPEDIRLTLAQLTGREREILRKVCGGLSNKQIARDFNITERTVKAHLSSIFRKSHTTDRLQLAMRMNDYCD